MKLFNLVAVPLLLLSLGVQSCSFLDKLSYQQRLIATQAYRLGEPYDLGLTMVAVAWQESKLGKYKMRYGKGKDVSVGVMHSNVYWKTKEMSAFSRGVWVENMMNNNALSLQTGLEDLLKWKKSYKGVYKGMLNGYNAGYGENPTYVNEVITTVRELKQCKF